MRFNRYTKRRKFN